MKEIPSASIEMVLCDPPYGVTRNSLDKKIPMTELWSQYKRILKPKGVVVLFGQGKFFLELIASNLQWYRYDLIWDKVLTSGFLNANRMPLRRHESIAVFYNSLPTYHPQFSIGKPLHSRGSSYRNKTALNRNYNDFKPTEDTRQGSIEKYPTSILRFNKPHPGVAQHPTEKPVALLEYLIRTYTSEGETVLDNCMGCGSTIVACMIAHRKFIGFELNQEYFDLAEQRIITAMNNCCIKE